jgi:hypothetical protein
MMGNGITHPPCEQVLAAMEGVLVLFWCPGRSLLLCGRFVLHYAVFPVEVGRGSTMTWWVYGNVLGFKMDNSRRRDALRHFIALVYDIRTVLLLDYLDRTWDAHPNTPPQTEDGWF